MTLKQSRHVSPSIIDTPKVTFVETIGRCQLSELIPEGCEERRAKGKGQDGGPQGGSDFIQRNIDVRFSMFGHGCQSKSV